MLERVWRKGNPLTLLVGMQTSTVWRLLKKLEIELPYDPAIPLLGIHIEKTNDTKDWMAKRQKNLKNKFMHKSFVPNSWFSL